MIQSLVSVVIPTFNRAVLLDRTLESIHKQEYSHWEALIIDDGSTDDTKEVVENWSCIDPRIQYRQRNGDISGGNRCRNIGLQYAKGDYILFLDSDDCLMPLCLEQRMVQAAAAPELDFQVFPGVTFTTDIAKPDFYWNVPGNATDLDRFFQFDSPWQTTGPLWKRRKLIEAGLLWDENLFLWQDIDFHVRAILAGLQYQVHWHLPYDYGVRSDSPDSTSRMDYFNKLKVSSRFSFWTKYVQRLEKDPGIINPPMLRPVLLSILQSAATAGRWTFAAEALRKAIAHSIIGEKENASLQNRLWLAKWTRNKVSFLSFPGKMAEKRLVPGGIAIQSVRVGSM
jgi:glycosyltransferase involved in cell wall biosynthesis